MSGVSSECLVNVGGGMRLRVGTRGEGHPLLLITGIGAAIEMWEPFIRELDGAPIQTIAFDAPGTGQSSGPGLPRRMPGLARIVGRLLDELGHERVDVLGVSFGGALAQQLARRAPRRVNRLILAATAPGMPGLGGVPGSVRSLLTMTTPRRYYDPDFIRTRGHILYGGGKPAHDVAEATRLQSPPPVHGYLQQLWAIQGWTAVPWLWTVWHPTLVLHGDDDRLLPVTNGRILARLLPNARLEIIRGGGHLFLLQRPAESARLIKTFLAAPAPAGRQTGPE